MSLEPIIGLVPLVLTLLVFSRLAGDNPAFRIVQYLFVGASLGYAFLVVYFQVLRPGVLEITSSGNPVVIGLRVTPFLLGLLLLTRITGRQSASWLANIPLALLFGVATALALGGAMIGTLVPQILDTVRIGGDPLQLVGGILLAVGVILTLCYFYFTAPRQGPGGQLLLISAQVGRWLLMTAFGFFFAGALLSYLTALNERMNFIVGWFRSLLG